MKKLLAILMLLALFVSCSDDDTTDPDNGNGNGKEMIDERILGKWKVGYSKTIEGAWFNENGTLEIAEGAAVIEYEGDFDGKEATIPKSGMFDPTEDFIKINKDNTIDVNLAGVIKPETIYYKIEDGLLFWMIEPIETPIDRQTIIAKHKYRLEGGRLIIERIPPLWNYYNHYTISEYSKMAE